MNVSIPVTAMERLAEERRHDPRIIAAAGWPAPPKARHLSNSVGAMLIRLGRWIEGTCPELAPAQSQ